jgi:hypothetical protein
LSVALLHLLEGMRSVEGRDGNVATVNDSQILFEGIDTPDGVVAPAFFLARGASADAARTKTCARTVRGACVVGKTENGNVKRLNIESQLVRRTFWENASLPRHVWTTGTAAIPGGRK